jgi:Spx/MgsR family transcriptional regulator
VILLPTSSASRKVTGRSKQENKDLITLYGIPNCDSCRAARQWLDQHAVAHRFHDVRVDGLELKTIHGWAQRVGWRELLNTRSKTWRTLSQSDRDTIEEGRALTLMYEQPTLIKRPVLQNGDKVQVGFSADQYQSVLQNLANQCGR